MRAFQIAALVETAVRDERERGIIRSKALEDAARQALGALEGWDNYGKWVWPESALEQARRNTTESLAALRAALAEPVEYAVEPNGKRSSLLTHMMNYRSKEERAALEEPVQEPVALESVYETIIQWDEGGGKRSRRELARRIVDLYTSPPQRKPLTDEEMKRVCAETWSFDPYEIARAIEEAHGII